MSRFRRSKPELVPMRRTIYLSDESGWLVLSSTEFSVMIIALNEAGQELWKLILPIAGATDSHGWKRGALLTILANLERPE